VLDDPGDPVVPDPGPPEELDPQAMTVTATETTLATSTRMRFFIGGFFMEAPSRTRRRQAVAAGVAVRHAGARFLG
jgi:hypothetical protein